MNQTLNIATYDIFDRRAHGKILKENTKTINVWFDGRVIVRHKVKHNVIEAPAMDWKVFYYADPKSNET